jgi:hypothetical protein
MADSIPPHGGHSETRRPQRQRGSHANPTRTTPLGRGTGTGRHYLARAAGRPDRELGPRLERRFPAGRHQSHGPGLRGMRHNAVPSRHQRPGRVPEDIVDWLVDHLARGSELAPGLYVGVAGIAYTLLETGRTDEAGALMTSVPRLPLHSPTPACSTAWPGGATHHCTSGDGRGPGTGWTGRPAPRRPHRGSRSRACGP